MPEITATPLSNGDIDEIWAQDARVSLRQDDRHNVILEITQDGATRRFRFRSRSPRNSPGIAIILDPGEPPPGAITADDDNPTRLRHYELPQGSIHVESLDNHRYWIGLENESCGGFLHIASSNKRSHIILTRQASP